ncbi:MAG TPA: alpha-ketoglutarate-dependent dioxygenase AlkB [Caulobacteraceae bacterium]|jgi:alkylated DNA repair dioxygenase AlkB
MSVQLALFAAPEPGAPEGFAYRPEVITPQEELALAARFETLPFKPYQFRGYEGARRTVAYGWRYADDGKAIERAQAIPDFLLEVRAKAAAFAGLEPEELVQALVIDYPPGAPIGWHRDRPAFGQVLGVSLLTPAPLRLRLERPDGGWDRITQVLEPRSAYRLSGPARHQWRHSIPPLDAQRYSITFRTLAKR